MFRFSSLFFSSVEQFSSYRFYSFIFNLHLLLDIWPLYCHNCEWIFLSYISVCCQYIESYLFQNIYFLICYYTTLLFFIYLFIYLFIFGCVRSSFLCEDFPQLRQAGATLHRGARASHCRGLSRCGAQAPDAQAQQPWLTGPVAPRHVGSSQTRARTRVPCIGRQTLNHCATREAPTLIFLIIYQLIFFFKKKNKLTSFLKYLFILFIFGCVGSLSCGMRDLSLWRTGSLLRHAGFSLVVACRLQGAWALWLWCAGSRARGRCSLRHAGSLVVAHGLSCPTTCGILVPWPGIEPVSLAL